MDTNFTTPNGHRQLRRTSGVPSESPTSPLSPLSPPPGIARLSASAFNITHPPPTAAKSTDNLILENFFGSENMNKLSAVLQPSTDSLASHSQRMSQSTDKLISTELPPLPEKRRSRGNPLSRSPRNSSVYTSTPDMSSLRRNHEPVSDVGMEMQRLRMRLRETANQTVAEIEERFSPKFNRLTLGPAIDLPSNHASSGTGHSHQGSLDSFPSPVPSAGRVASSSGHGRQHSLPLSVIGQTKPHSPPKHSAPSPPKSPSPVSQQALTSPSSRSPTPPHQQHNPPTRQTSSSSISGLITTCYQTQDKSIGGYHHNHHQRPAQPQPYEVATGISVHGSHGRAPPPSMSRQYSPGTQPGVNRAGGMGDPSTEQDGYVYGRGRSNGGRVYASNPNLLGGSGSDSSTHYSTAVIKKRRSSGTKNGTESQNNPHNNYGGRAHEYDQFQSAGYNMQSPPQPQPQGPNHSHRMGRTHSPNTQYTNGKMAHHPPHSYHHQTSVPPSTSETNFKRAAGQIKPYMSTGELRASMRQFQYVPFAEQKRSLAVGRGHSGQQDPENTWL